MKTLLTILFWPFILVWKLISLLFCFTGRLFTAIFGIILMIVGIILIVTVVGGIVGIPLLVLGITLIVRALF